MGLSTDQVQIIKSTVPVLQEHGDAITKHFYEIVINENPALNDIFNRTNQVTNRQPEALASALYAYASNIDNLGVLGPAVEKICHKHASLYVQPAHYEVVGTYLLRAMGDILGAALTPDILEAWKAAYWQLADLVEMIGKENSLYKASQGWTEWRDFRISKKQPESAEITSFYLEPVDGKPLPLFLPGRYISVLLDVPKLNHLQPRQYSLSDLPNEKYYRISVKRHSDPQHPGYVSNVLHNDKGEGDIIKVSYPEGEFFLDSGDSPVVLISAGVGLTPMVSILNSLIQSGSKRPISWIYGVRSTSVQPFGADIQNIAQTHTNVQTVIFNRNPDAAAKEGTDYHYKSRVDLDVLDRNAQLFLDQQAEYFISGPEGFPQEIKGKLGEYQVPPTRIHTDVFGVGIA